MSTADFWFLIESKDPIFLDLQALLYCFLREKSPGVLIRGRILILKKLTLAFLGLSKSSVYLGEFFE